MANRTKRTQKRITAFLAALSDGHSPGGAARMIGVARSCVYEWRAADPDFAAQWEASIEEGTDIIEDEALRRAVNGVPKPIFYKGVKLETVQEYSDTLMVTILKARRPEKYRERFEHTGADGAPLIPPTISVMLDKVYSDGNGDKGDGQS